MNRRARICICFLIGAVVASCAGQQPRRHDFDDIETFGAPYERVWSVVERMAEEKHWRIEEKDKTARRAYLATHWMVDEENGGDYGRSGIALGQSNNPLRDKSREVAISIRVVPETPTTTRVKTTCLFRVQTSQGQTMFGTSKGIVERRILDTIRTRLN